MSAPRPYNVVAELTYRCPLRCVYCSNPVSFADVRDALDAEAWSRVFHEAASLGAVHVGLTGGEPSARPDLPEIVSAAAAAGLYVHLVTSGRPLGADGLADLVRRGLRSVQLSFQDSRADEADLLAGTRAHAAKLDFAEAVRKLDLPLTVNVVLHRRNLDRVEEVVALARRLDADRVELANAQYHGWALVNRDALLPTRTQLDAAAQAVARARRQSPRPEIVWVLADYFADRPKPCMGGWGRRTLVIAPDGRVLPCHGAGELPLEFWNAAEQPLAACWADAPGMNAFRGEAWMPQPCASCPERTKDFGGCRCQAFRLTGDAAATDPACTLSPHHARVRDAREPAARPELVLRGARPSKGR